MEPKPPLPPGYYESTHLIERGDSISKVTNHYRTLGWNLPGWQPVWRLNTLVYHNLRDRANPDRIYPGDVLIMPRTPLGYDAHIDQLSSIMSDTSAFDRELENLEGLSKESERHGENYDLAADIATLGVGVGMQGFKAAMLLKEGKDLSGAALFHNRRLLVAAKRAAAEKVAEFVKDKARGYVVKSAAEATLGTEKGKSFTDNTYEPANRIAKNLGQAINVAGWCDVAEMALEWIKPSTIARGFLKLTTGQTPEESIDSAKLSVAAARSRFRLEMHQRIEKVQRERRLVYGG